MRKVLIGLMALGSLSANALEMKQTLNGARFVRNFDYPLLGESWKDERGVIWGDAKKNSHGEVDNYINFFEATEYCEKIGARLPTKKEFDLLREDMFKIKSRSPSYGNYVPQILPSLKNNKSVNYWSSTEYVTKYGDITSWSFSSVSGHLVMTYQEVPLIHGVRCVMGSVVK